MKKALILYSSTDGQTIKISEFIGKELDDHQCDILSLHENQSIKLEDYDKVLIGASIRYGHLHKEFYKFVTANKSRLERINAAFFLVNLTARKEDQGKDTPEGSAYVKTFLKKSPWTPNMIGVFAGALLYPRYKLFDRLCIQFIMKITGGETDSSKEIEYTNWEKVAIFARKFKEL
ncbi:menaquinone-dependent protoporphyrinogen IX dehydrogenase [Vibrio sp. JC009]|uniref:menaquinone-dependent protoporphyrinogen IX dehydrogenase n=1 Tax=Vibrio sp. JC009 TaxID=2912314 RepID=UPI0023B2026C|nr:menaquinone-dependent protoporphyrinogen IX dehydrogenase [Vibrio sp. JC009]WED21866.1 menaquinone-dependent protoporphyrinogen IX dehydrogenase [Vibrio sp. JC009]